MDNEQEPIEEVPPVKQTTKQIQYKPYPPARALRIPEQESDGAAREIIQPNNNAQYLAPPQVRGRVEYSPAPSRSEQVIQPSQPRANALELPEPEETKIEETFRSMDSESGIPTKTEAAKKSFWGNVSPITSSLEAVARNKYVQKGVLTAVDTVSPIPIKALLEAQTNEDRIRALAGLPSSDKNTELLARIALRAVGVPPGSAELAGNLLNHAASYMSPNGSPDNNNNNNQGKVVNEVSPGEGANAQNNFERISNAVASRLPKPFWA